MNKSRKERPWQDKITGDPDAATKVNKSSVKGQPSPITGRAEARVDEHRVVERRPLDRGAAPAEPARVGSFPLAGTTQHREFPLETAEIRD